MIALLCKLINFLCVCVQDWFSMYLCCGSPECCGPVSSTVSLRTLWFNRMPQFCFLYSFHQFMAVIMNFLWRWIHFILRWALQLLDMLLKTQATWYHHHPPILHSHTSPTWPRDPKGFQKYLLTLLQLSTFRCFRWLQPSIPHSSQTVCLESSSDRCVPRKLVWQAPEDGLG